MEALAAGGSSLVLRRGASLIRRSSSAASSATTVLASPGENDDPQHGGAVAAKPPQPTPDTAPAILEQSPSKLRRRAAFGRVREPKPAAVAVEARNSGELKRPPHTTELAAAAFGDPIRLTIGAFECAGCTETAERLLQWLWARASLGLWTSTTGQPESPPRPRVARL